jgi:hypothetical protein
MLITIPSAASDLTPASEVLAGSLGTFPLVWSTFIIVICSGAVSSESSVVADSILSKAVTRYHYILAKFLSRLVAMLGVYLVIALPSTYLLSENAVNDLSQPGVRWAILSVGMMLLLLTSLSVAFSTVFNRTLVALVVVWVIWYVSSGVLTLFQLDVLSPLIIIDKMVDTLRGNYDSGEQFQIFVAFGLLSVGTITGAIFHFAHKDL